MSNKFDVIVIGSGLGGLSAALECSRAGKKILLVEQHNLPGGYASSFTRGRFEFEPSLHELPNTRVESTTSGVIRYLLDDAKLRIKFLEIPEAYRVILTDQHVDARSAHEYHAVQLCWQTAFWDCCHTGYGRPGYAGTVHGGRIPES